MINLDTIYLQLTKSCNLHCSYCYLDAGKRMQGELETQQWLDVIDDILLLKPKRVVFAGGEPLIRSDLFLLADRIKNSGEQISLVINTNGTLISSENASYLVNSFHEIRISIDGPEEVNSTMRGSGVTKKVLKAFEYVFKEGGEPFAFITVTDANFRTLTKTLDFLLQNGITKIHVSRVKKIGRASQQKVSFTNADLMESVASYWHLRFGLHIEKNEPDKNNCINCGVGRFLTVYPDGSIYPCHVLAQPEFLLGNVRTSKISEIFYNSRMFQTLRNSKYGEIAECDECIEDL